MLQGRAGRSLDPYEETDNMDRSRSIDIRPGGERVEHPPGLTAVVLTRDRSDLMLPLLDRLAETAEALRSIGLGFEAVVGDTGSTEEALIQRYARPPDWLSVVRNLDYHFSSCNNACVTAAPKAFDTVLLLNNDVVLPGADPLLRMLEQIRSRVSVGVAGLRMLLPDGSLQHGGIDIVRSGFRRGLPWHPPEASNAGELPRCYPAVAVTGACLMVRRSLWDRLGGLDPAYDRECQDVDLCLGVRRLGYEVIVVDAGPVVHLQGATRGPADESSGDRRLFLRRWSGFLGAFHL